MLLGKGWSIPTESCAVLDLSSITYIVIHLYLIMCDNNSDVINRWIDVCLSIVMFPRVGPPMIMSFSNLFY